MSAGITVVGVSTTMFLQKCPSRTHEALSVVENQEINALCKLTTLTMLTREIAAIKTDDDLDVNVVSNVKDHQHRTENRN